MTPFRLRDWGAFNNITKPGSSTRVGRGMAVPFVRLLQTHPRYRQTPGTASWNLSGLVDTSFFI